MMIAVSDTTPLISRMKADNRISLLRKRRMCGNEKPGAAPHSNGTAPGYEILQIPDTFDVDKKSERRPAGNEVRISQLWWTVRDSNP